MPLEQFTLLTDEEFYQIHGVEKQVPLLLALSNQEDWGYVAKKINRRNGKTAWKIVNHKDNIIEVQHIATDNQLADIMTKALTPSIFSPASMQKSRCFSTISLPTINSPPTEQ